MRISLAVLLLTALLHAAFAATTEPAKDPQVDPAPCNAAVVANDDDRIVAACGVLVDSDKTPKADRIKALIARGAAYGRKDQADRAIGDYDVWRCGSIRRWPISSTPEANSGAGKGDLPHALADFGAALKLNPQHEAARANYKSLALELERIGAQMAVKNKLNPPLK